MNITKNNYGALVRGASLYATGGGLEHDNQLAFFERIFQQYEAIPVVSCDDLEEDEYICTAYGIGSAGNTNVDFSPAVEAGRKAFQEKTGKKYKGIFVGETNIEALTAQIACTMNLPIVDADATGGRAVPEIRLDNFFVAGISTAPIVVSDLQGNSFCIEDSRDPASVEKQVRSFAKNAYLQTAVVFDHSIAVKDAKKVLTTGIVKRSFDAGAYLLSSQINDQQALATLGDMRWISSGTIVEHTVQENVLNGFLEGMIFIQTQEGRYRIFVRNENLICWKNDELFVTAPDSIILFDPKQACGLHSSKLSVGMQVDLFVKKATPLWRSERGCAFFSPTYFGIDEPVRLLA